jgi:hypothetical protein
MHALMSARKKDGKEEEGGHAIALDFYANNRAGINHAIYRFKSLLLPHYVHPLHPLRRHKASDL